MLLNNLRCFAFPNIVPCSYFAEYIKRITYSQSYVQLSLLSNMVTVNAEIASAFTCLVLSSEAISNHQKFSLASYLD